MSVFSMIHNLYLSVFDLFLIQNDAKKLLDYYGDIFRQGKCWNTFLLYMFSIVNIKLVVLIEL